MRYILILVLFFSPTGTYAQKQGKLRIDSMQNELSKYKEDTDKVKQLYRLSYYYYEYDQEEGIRLGNDALTLAKKLGWQKGIAWSYNSIAVNYQALGDHAAALENHLNSLKINEAAGYRLGIARNLGNIAYLYQTEGNTTKALEYMFRALKINEELNNAEGIAAQLGNIGIVYDRLGKSEKALEYEEMALKKYIEINDSISIAKQLGNIGMMYGNKKDINKAMQYYERAIVLYKMMGNTEGVARNMSNIASAYSENHDYITAIEWTKKSIEIYEQSGSIDLNGVLYFNLGTFCSLLASTDDKQRANHLKQAIAYGEKATALLAKTNNTYGLCDNYKMLAEAQALVGDNEKSVRNYKQYILFKDSLTNRETSKKIFDLEKQRELDLKENQIKVLAADLKLKELSATKDKLTRGLLSAGLVIVVIIALYFIRKQKSDKLIANERINTLLKEQELQSVSSMLEVQELERKRIAADLHDRLGSMLSTVKLYFNTVEEQIDNLKAQNKEQYHKATTLLDEACDEVRKISHNLVSGELVKFGLVSALQQLKNTMEDAGKLKMNVLAFGMEERLDSTTEISLYRVVQELMNNMLKHAKATEVTIQLNRVDDNLNIVVEDNGVGFDVAAALDKDGMGLRNMETRVKKMRGVITFDSGKGRGTTTIIDIPV